MEGDTFEMEDQRNWGDASYKTYVRPLSLPWGYTLAKGSRLEQAVQLSFDGRLEGRGEEKGSDVRIKLGGNLAANMPDLGVALPAEEASAALAASDALRTLNPHFLVSNVDARDGRELAELEAYRRVAEAVSAGLVLEIVIPDERDAAASLAPVAEAVRRARLTLEVGRRLERGRFEILAARRKAPRETDGRRDLHSCARCFSRRKAWRRHALHLHRTQSKAAEGRAFRLCDPYDMLDRSCCRRSLCDGDARNAVGHHRLDQGDDWR